VSGNYGRAAGQFRHEGRRGLQSTVSFTAPRATPIGIAGPAGNIEALLEEPAGQRVAAFGVICHPHPLGGGTMTNKVVHALARAMQKCGAPTLRFNFRGVGASAGVFDDGAGETQDALAVIAAGRERWPCRSATPRGLTGW
jgi:alpha/beta superfamily hydrolase